MAKGGYIGVNGVARKMKGGYIGVDGVARKIKKMYIGVNGVARLCWQDDPGWQLTTLPVTANWKSICYGNGKFVAVANNSNKLIYSTNGIDWTQVTLPVTASWRSICYGNGKFVAVAYDGTIAYSSDGISFTCQTVAYDQMQGTLVYNNINGNYKLYKWTTVFYGNGKYIVGTDASSVMLYSTDGKTWNLSNFGVMSSIPIGAYGNGKFVVGVGNYTCYYSSNGIDWTSGYFKESPYPSFKCICYGKNKFVALGLSTYPTDQSWYACSSNGVDWTTGTISTIKQWSSVCYGNGKFVAVPSSGDVAIFSTNGITWSQILLPSSHEWTSVCYGNGIFVAVANDGTIAYWM